MPRCLPLLALLLFASTAIGQTLPATQTASQPTTRAAVTDEELSRMFGTELGDRFVAADLPKYLAAHAMVERYFAAPLKDRRGIVAEIEATGVDANLLGRLTRLRRSWQDLSPGTYFINETLGSTEVKYFLGIPDSYTRALPKPLVIVLPTADEFLTDPPADNAAVATIYRGWMKEELARQKDAIVVMPLLNLDELYGPSRPGMNSVLQSMQHAASVANIDPRQVYLMGHSMAGHAIWNLSLHTPTYFSAIAPLAGAASADWQRLRLMNLRNVYPVIWHDADDQIIPIDGTRQLVRVLRKYEYDLHLIETKTVGHTPPPNVLAQVTESMRGRTRELYPPVVNLQSNKLETAFNRSDWLQIYQPIRIGSEQRLQLSRGTGPMIVYQSTWNLRASIGKNRINAQSENTAAMRFYLNDQMIDFAKPVTVALNGKNRYEGVLSPSVDEMLKDQVFIGRGWRYFTAVIDLDLGPPATRPTSRPTTRPQ